MVMSYGKGFLHLVGARAILRGEHRERGALPMPESTIEGRRLLRALLAALIAEREDAQLLYIPHGEAGQRRMIRALLDVRPPREPDPLAPRIEAFLSGEGDQP